MADISIIIRTLNERLQLFSLLGALKDQTMFDRAEIIVVDNESTDGTVETALEHGARVITIKRDEFSFPRSLNMGAEAAQGKFLIFTVGHALPFRKDWLISGLEHLSDPRVAGVYSPVIPHTGCSLAEKLFYWPNYLWAKFRGPHQVTHHRMGVFGATNIGLRKELWLEHPFDERYGLGGEHGEWAAWAINEKGLCLMCDVRFSVRHSHGLGCLGMLRQIFYWSARLAKPMAFDRKRLSFRKDLKF
ncbi:MAG: glycosyltransferase [Patescibacteria group bacterium]